MVREEMEKYKYIDHNYQKEITKYLIRYKKKMESAWTIWSKHVVVVSKNKIDSSKQKTTDVGRLFRWKKFKSGSAVAVFNLKYYLMPSPFVQQEQKYNSKKKYFEEKKTNKVKLRPPHYKTSQYNN